MKHFPHFNWLLLATLLGSFWGVFALFFYTPWTTMKWRKFQIVRSVYIILFQFFFNFIGGFLGCFGFAIFLGRYSQGHLGISELLLLCAALLGVSGKLSEIIYRLPENVAEGIKGYLSRKFQGTGKQ